MSPRRSVITLTTDFGHSDSYVAALKGVLLCHAPNSLVVDITHNIPPHDILAASITLERAITSFPANTVHLAVVDPGVGTSRRILLVKLKNTAIICPDNGLITWTWRLNPAATAHEITWRPPRFTNTFHGRDIMAPLAGMLATRASLAHRTRPISDPILLDIKPATNPYHTQIIHIDHFGNATTNLQKHQLLDVKISSVRIGRRNIGPIRDTYADVPIGSPIALIGSSGLLEIAVRNGSAAQKLNLKVGDKISLK